MLATFFCINTIYMYSIRSMYSMLLLYWWGSRSIIPFLCSSVLFSLSFTNSEYVFNDLVSKLPDIQCLQFVKCTIRSNKRLLMHAKDERKRKKKKERKKEKNTQTTQIKSTNCESKSQWPTDTITSCEERTSSTI